MHMRDRDVRPQSFVHAGNIAVRASYAVHCSIMQHEQSFLRHDDAPCSSWLPCSSSLCTGSYALQSPSQNMQCKRVQRLLHHEFPLHGRLKLMSHTAFDQWKRIPTLPLGHVARWPEGANARPGVALHRDSSRLSCRFAVLGPCCGVV